MLEATSYLIRLANLSNGCIVGAGSRLAAYWKRRATWVAIETATMADGVCRIVFKNCLEKALVWIRIVKNPDAGPYLLVVCWKSDVFIKECRSCRLTTEETIEENTVIYGGDCK